MTCNIEIGALGRFSAKAVFTFIIYTRLICNITATGRGMQRPIYAKHDYDTLPPKLSPLGFLSKLTNVYSIASLNFEMHMCSKSCSTF
jgi:hypothetical protein